MDTTLRKLLKRVGSPAGKMSADPGKEYQMGQSEVAADRLDVLTTEFGQRAGATASMVEPFADFTDLMTDLLARRSGTCRSLLVAGHATPDIQIAADRAGLELVEALGESPFRGDMARLFRALRRDALIYVANPNWVTGANYSLRELEQVAAAIPDGTLFLDEKYFDFFGITGLELVQRHPHVMVLRSPAAGFAVGVEDPGFLIGAPILVRSLRGVAPWSRLSAAQCRLLSSSVSTEDAVRKRVDEVRREGLRLATELMRLGIQNRLAAADFVLLRVADPRRVGNYLAGRGTPVENLHGYPELANYMRCRIQSPRANDRFLMACSRMPREYFYLPDVDCRAQLLRRPPQVAAKHVPAAPGLSPQLDETPVAVG